MTRSLQGRHILAVTPALDGVTSAALHAAHVRLAPIRALDIVINAGPAPDLILIDGDGVDVSLVIPFLDSLAHAAAPPVLVTGGRLPTALIRAVLRLPRADLLETPFDTAAFAEAAQRLLAPPSTHPGASKCWSVMGTVGGCGATTIAIEIAAALAARKPAPRVCLVDLNLADGAAAGYLGASANMILSSAASSERIDGSVLAAFVSVTDEGFDLLAAPRHPEAFRTVHGEVVMRVLEMACAAYDWVVVDLPRHRQAWTLDVVAGSDEVILVSELTVPALLAARAQSNEIEAESPQAPQSRIVLNRLASRLLATVPTLKEAQKALGRTAAAGVSSDWEAAAASVNLGGVIRRHRPRSKIVRDIDALVSCMVAAPVRRLDHPAAA